MFKEITNNVYNALFVAADEDGRRYAAFESDWNGEYWEATACTESGDLIKGETVKLYPIMVYLAESDQYETIGYDEEAPRVLIPGWRDYQKRGYNESYTIAPRCLQRSERPRLFHAAGRRERFQQRRRLAGYRIRRFYPR